MKFGYNSVIGYNVFCKESIKTHHATTRYILLLKSSI